MGIRTVLIVEAAHAAKLSIVAGAMNFPQDFTQARKVCAIDADATPNTPPTHYLAHDVGMASDFEQKFRLMAAGEFLPQVVWADIPNITETSANAAAAALTVISEAGAMGAMGSVEDMLAARGLQYVPEVKI